MGDLFDVHKSTLKSMLLDEEKLLTYVSISKELCVHVNNSKSLLRRLVQSIRQEIPNYQLNVSYIVSGSTDTNNARTIVCSEQDLSNEKDCFKNIFYEHIYSISKGRHCIDTAAFLTVNKFEDIALCTGLIKSDKCNKRTSAEIGNLKSSSQEIVIPEKSKSLPILGNIKQDHNLSKNSNVEIKTISKDSGSKLEVIIKQEVSSPKKATGNNKQKVNTSNNHKTQTGISGFLKKTNSNADEQEKLQNGSDNTKVKLNKTGAKIENLDVEEIKPVEASLKNDCKKENCNNKILNQIKKSSKLDKKRKRLLHVSDSESDNENNDPFVDEIDAVKDQASQESEDEIPSTPNANNIVIKSGIVNPKKRRKIVDKTYTDEDGYILTKKEEVYESCSDNEDDVKVKPQTKEVKLQISHKGKSTVSKKKVSPPQKGKQATLTNFFKRV